MNNKKILLKRNKKLPNFCKNTGNKCQFLKRNKSNMYKNL